MHAAVVVEILQSIRQADMSPLLGRIYQAEGGVELCDVLTKYLCVLFELFPEISAHVRIVTKEWHNLPNQIQPTYQRAMSPHKRLASPLRTREEAVKVVLRQ